MTPFFYSSPPRSRFISWVVAAYLLLATVGWFAWLIQFGKIYLLFMPVVLVVPWMVVRGYKVAYEIAGLGIVMLSVSLLDPLFFLDIIYDVDPPQNLHIPWIVAGAAACLVLIFYCLRQHQKIRMGRNFPAVAAPAVPFQPLGMRTFLLRGSFLAWLVTGIVAVNLLLVFAVPAYRVLIVNADIFWDVMGLIWLAIPLALILGWRAGYQAVELISTFLCIILPLVYLNPLKFHEQVDIGNHLHAFWQDAAEAAVFECFLLLSIYCLRQHQAQRTLAGIRQSFNAPPGAAPDPASPPPA